jgi:hypothetical protein
VVGSPEVFGVGLTVAWTMALMREGPDGLFCRQSIREKDNAPVPLTLLGGLVSVAMAQFLEWY